MLKVHISTAIYIFADYTIHVWYVNQVLNTSKKIKEKQIAL